MNALEKIKLAAAELSPDEQVELFRWWVATPAFKTRQLSALKSEIAVGIADLEHGRYRSYTGASVMELAEEVAQLGRANMLTVREPPGK